MPARKNPDSHIFSIFSFADKKVQRLIWLLKYKNGQRVADVLGVHMAVCLELCLLKNEQQKLPMHGILVPIPLSKERYRERGYNQAELLAKSMVHATSRSSHNLSLRVETQLLVKTHNTFAQAKVRQRSLRQKNISDCFLVNAGRVSLTSTIILVDDVTTTGTTLSEARKALKRAGFQYIYAQTAAH
jgi:ComF family protein